MYNVHFLEGDANLNEEAQRTIEQSVESLFPQTSETLNLKECDILVSINTKKIPNNDMFLGLSYEESIMYLFADADTVHKNLTESNGAAVAKRVAENCCRGLYTTARTKHIGLEADCGLLEEVINEGLAEIFAAEIADADPNRHATLTEREIQHLWNTIQHEAREMNPDIEKWFWGNKQENIPPHSACTVGYAIANAYLNTVHKKSFEVLTTPAKTIALLQNRY